MTQPQQPDVYMLMLSKQALAGINAALMQAPYYVAQPIIDEINRQIQQAKQQQTTKPPRRMICPL